MDLYQIDDKIINVEIQYKPKNKHMYLRFKNNKLIITSFKRLNKKEIKELIEQNIYVIKKCMLKSVILEHENSIHVFGIKYKINVIKANINAIDLKDGIANIYVKNSEEAYIKRIVRTYYNKITEAYINAKITEVKQAFSDLDTTNVIINYKYIKTYFGKCYPGLKKIFFSGMCAKLETKYIDYVIYHEFAHFKYAGHQADFYNYLESKLKKARIYQKEIRKIRFNDQF